MRIKRAAVFAVIFSFSIFLLGLTPTNLLAKEKYECFFSKRRQSDSYKYFWGY